MKHCYYADDAAEAQAIEERLEWYGNYGSLVSQHNLLVTWWDDELNEKDWNWVEERAEEIRTW